MIIEKVLEWKRINNLWSEISWSERGLINFEIVLEWKSIKDLVWYWSEIGLITYEVMLEWKGIIKFWKGIGVKLY